jgi:hypothetical protein
MAGAFIDSFALPLTPQQEDTLNQMSSDLRFILSECEVPSVLQAAISGLGYKALNLFAVLADDRAGIRTCCKDVLGIDLTDTGLTAAQLLAGRLATTQVLAAWVTAQARHAEAEKVTAENRSSRMPMTLPKSTLIAIRQRFTKEFGKVSDKLWPCSTLLEQRIQEVEEGNLTAQPLTDILAEEDGPDENFVMLDSGGAIRTRKAPKAIPLPATTEELRNRIRTLGITYTAACYKHSSRVWLRSTSPALWLEYVEYILGEQVAAYHLDSSGQTVVASWTTVLSYELAIRKLMVHRVLYENEDIATALRYACKDLSTKERHFITPTALRRNPGGDSSSSAFHGTIKTISKREQRQANYWQAKGKGKSDKGKSSKSRPGKNSKGAKWKHSKTPDGRSICFAFQDNSCKKSSCNFVHACGNCLGTHGAVDCKA